MSAPRPDVETQTRRHPGPIIGMVGVVIFALVLLVWQMMSVAEEGPPVGTGMDEIKGRTGEPVPQSAPTDGTPPDDDVPTTPDGDVPRQTPPAPPPAPIPDTNAQP